MRSARFGLLIFLLLGVSVQAQQSATPQQAAPAQPASDPQAVAVVQAAITALGGATAINQAKSWTFQASVQGPIADGNVNYTMSNAFDTTAYIPLDNGLKKPAPLIRSLFVPVAVASILVSESQDPSFFIKYRGPITIDAKGFTVIDFFVAGVPFAVQEWCFDATTNIPISINFRLSAQIGQRVSSQGIVELSDYRVVAGVLYPFQISTQIARSFLPEVITIQSVASKATPSQSDYDSAAGDLTERAR
jgi:hypothetical protein